MIESEVGRRVKTTSYFYNDPAEMKQFYFDVLSTGAQTGTEMPHPLAMRK